MLKWKIFLCFFKIFEFVKCWSTWLSFWKVCGRFECLKRLNVWKDCLSTTKQRRVDIFVKTHNCQILLYTWDPRKQCIIFFDIFLLVNVKMKVIQKPFVWVRTKIVLPHAPPPPPPPRPLFSHFLSPKKHFLSPKNNPNYHQHYPQILHSYKLDYL